jgi:UDP-N-acetylglucosamine 2-epimerase (non-hydrolysing)
MKVAPLLRYFEKIQEDKISCLLIHTGQHYDYCLNQNFFKDLNLKEPDCFLNAGSGSHAEQTAKILVEFEKACVRERPDLVVVVGDVNSTLACSIVAKKIYIKVAHIEAGLRSFNRSMPEEINRIVTDSISDYFFTTTKDAVRQLEKEGIDPENIFFVGNLMIDSIVYILPKTEKSEILEKLSLQPFSYTAVTLHRPENVDREEFLQGFLAFCRENHNLKMVFPAHPRTLKNIRNFSLKNEFKKLNNLILVEPLGYIDFIKLLKDSQFVITDSGGLQEETTYLGIPCFTLRDETERPITIEKGTNILIKKNGFNKLTKEIKNLSNTRKRKKSLPELWDGNSASRIYPLLKQILQVDKV